MVDENLRKSLSGDNEEEAYIYAMRYLSMFQIIHSSKEFMGDDVGSRDFFCSSLGCICLWMVYLAELVQEIQNEADGGDDGGGSFEGQPQNKVTAFRFAWLIDWLIDWWVLRYGNWSLLEKSGLISLIGISSNWFLLVVFAVKNGWQKNTSMTLKGRVKAKVLDFRLIERKIDWLIDLVVSCDFQKLFPEEKIIIANYFLINLQL